MNDWRNPCEHGRYDAHDFDNHWQGISDCPGGSPVTTADLEADTELVERIRTEVGWLYVSLDVREVSRTITDAFVRNLIGTLIPIPDPQPATEGM